MDTIKVTTQEKNQIVLAEFLKQEESAYDCIDIYRRIQLDNPLYESVFETIFKYANSFIKCMLYSRMLQHGCKLKEALLFKGLNYARSTKRCLTVCGETFRGTPLWEKASIKALRYIRTYPDAIGALNLFKKHSDLWFDSMDLALEYATTTDECLINFDDLPYSIGFKFLKKAGTCAKSTTDHIKVLRILTRCHERDKAIAPISGGVAILKRAHESAESLDDHVLICVVAPEHSVYETRSLKYIKERLRELPFEKRLEVLTKARIDSLLKAEMITNLRENIESMEQFLQARAYLGDKPVFNQFILDELLRNLLCKTNDFKTLMEIFFEAPDLSDVKIEALDRAYQLCVKK